MPAKTTAALSPDGISLRRLSLPEKALSLSVKKKTYPSTPGVRGASMRPMQNFRRHRENGHDRKKPSSGDFQATGESGPPKFPIKRKKISLRR